MYITNNNNIFFWKGMHVDMYINIVNVDCIVFLINFYAMSTKIIWKKNVYMCIS